MIDVPSPGYIARLTFADASGVAPLGLEAHNADQERRQARERRNSEALRMWRHAGNGRDAEGRIDFDVMPPPSVLDDSPDPNAIQFTPVALEFQPLPCRWQCNCHPMVGRVRVGESALLRFDAPKGFAQPFELAGRIVDIQDAIVRVEPDDKTTWWLREYFKSAIGRTPTSDRMSSRYASIPAAAPANACSCRRRRWFDRPAASRDRPMRRSFG